MRLLKANDIDSSISICRRENNPRPRLILRGSTPDNSLLLLAPDILILRKYNVLVTWSHCSILSYIWDCVNGFFVAQRLTSVNHPWLLWVKMILDSSFVPEIIIMAWKMMEKHYGNGWQFSPILFIVLPLFLELW